MAERKRSRRTAISLFTGAGGMDLGLRMAGFVIKACVEIDHTSCETLRANGLCERIYESDIKTLSPKAILTDCGIAKGELDLIAAGPPCQSFSNIGNRRGMDDPRGRLFDELMRFADEIRPAFVLTENVPGMKTLEGGKVVDAVVKEFGRIGYEVSVKELNAADYGVPQVRRRLFFVASRDGMLFEYPRPTHASPRNSGGLPPWASVREAFGSLPSDYRSRPDNLTMRHAQYMMDRMHLVKPGKNFKSLPAELLPRCWTNGSHEGQDTFGRLELDRPSVTIRTAGYNPTKGRYIHPTEDRGLSTLEMAVIQSFPPEYTFVGSLKEVGAQVGNAVPPLLAKALGEQLARLLDRKAPYIPTLLSLTH